MNTITTTLKASFFKKFLKWLGLFLLGLVIALMILSVIVYFLMDCACSGTSTKNRESTYINTLSAGIKNVYTGSTDFNQLSNAIIIKTGEAPEAMIKGPTTLKNGYGGLVMVEAITLPMPVEAIQNNAYKIVYHNVLRRDCPVLATGLDNTFIQIEVNAQIIKKYPSKEDIGIERAKKACSEKENTMVFYGN